MKRPRPTSTSTPSDDLTRLVRRSRLLDPIAKRHWLKLLHYLTPVDRSRLEEILLADSSHSEP